MSLPRLPPPAAATTSGSAGNSLGRRRLSTSRSTTFAEKLAARKQQKQQQQQQQQQQQHRQRQSTGATRSTPPHVKKSRSSGRLSVGASQAKAAAAARRKAQKTAASRLAASDGPLGASGPDDALPRNFTTPDGACTLPYLVMGTPPTASAIAAGAVPCSFVVVPDLFDTYESLQILLRPLVRRLPACQVLLMNLPGQAFTEYKESVPLNNDLHASCVSELLVHVNDTGELPLASRCVVRGGACRCVAGLALQPLASVVLLTATPFLVLPQQPLPFARPW